MSESKKIMIVGGGSGGHIFPGLEIAHYLINQNWKVRWIGTSNRMESVLVPKHGIEIDFIRISSFRGKNFKKLFSALIDVFISIIQSRSFMKKFKPDLVLGMGGYISGPGGLAAWSLGIPIILHEQNSVAGLTNKWLAKIAKKVIQAFPGAFPEAKIVGNPIRMSISMIPHPEIRFAGRNGPIRILVTGGSQGANILNKVMPKIAERLGEKISIWHQSGKGIIFNQVKNSYKKISKKLQYRVTEFIENIDEAYAWADIIICRAGALTVSEIITVGLPALFVPFEHKDNQQYWNAVQLEKVGAAKIFRQKEFTVESVTSVLLKYNRSILLKMAKYARSEVIFNSTEKVVKEIKKIVTK